MKPLLDVEEPLPPVEVAKEPDRASEIPARPPVMVEPEPRETPDAPPPIDSPKPEARVEPADPDADADQPLAGRPRLARPSARRDALPPGVPPVSFPKTYYGRDPLPEASEKPSPREEAKPWTWRPRLLKRLRGESL